MEVCYHWKPYTSVYILIF